MGIYSKNYGLATESEYGLNRVGTDTFTRDKAEKLAKLWAETYPAFKPLLVINLKGQ